MIDYDRLLGRDFPDVEHSYTDKDTILYALGLGLGSDPLDDAQLRSVYERHPDFGALPSMAVVLAGPGFWAMEPDTGLTWQKILHGEQSFTLHSPLPAKGTLIGKTKIARIVDKGADKGALLYIDRTLHDAATGDHVATLTSTAFARGDGGFDGPSGPLRAVHQMPDGPADCVFDHKTPASSALIYRLSGDDNPLHADPEVARGAGFDRPILHGLCTLGVASWSIAQAVGNGDPAAVTHLQLRFSSPVYPGETIRTEIWQDGSDVSFRARVLDRDVVVLNNGFARLGPQARGEG